MNSPLIYYLIIAQFYSLKLLLLYDLLIIVKISAIQLYNMNRSFTY